MTGCGWPWPPPRRKVGRSRCPALPPTPRRSAALTAAIRSTTRRWPSSSDPERSVPDAVHHYFQPVHWSVAAGVPITYVLNERDRPVLPEIQDVMAQRLPDPVEVIRVDSGHLLPVTSPVVFAAIVNRVAA